MMLWLLMLPAIAGSSWVRVETDHFKVYSHAGQQNVFTMALAFEAFRGALAKAHPEMLEEEHRPAVPIVAFASGSEFGQFVVPPAGRRPKGPDTIALGGPRPLAAVDASRWEATSADVFADYVAALTSARTGAPLWLREGLAEFYRTTEIDGTNVVVGQAVLEHLNTLANGKWNRFEDVLAADHRSPLLKERRRAMFVAQAWLLVHWCLTDPDGARKARVGELLDASGRVRVVDSMFFTEVPLARSWLNDALRSYFDGKRFPEKTLDVSDRVDPAKVAVVEVPVVEIEYRLGQILTASEKYEQALSLFQHAQSVDPASWMPYDGLGQLAEAGLRMAEARRFYQEAASRNPTGAGPLLDHGRTALTSLRRKAARPVARTAFEQALALDATQLVAYSGLSDVAYRDRDWAEASRWAARGLQVDPRDSRLRAMLGRAQFAAGDFAHARLNTQLALQQCRDHRACSEAEALVRVVLTRDGG